VRARDAGAGGLADDPVDPPALPAYEGGDGTEPYRPSAWGSPPAALARLRGA